MSGQNQGIDKLKQASAHRPDDKTLQIPIVAIGGITLELARKSL